MKYEKNIAKAAASVCFSMLVTVSGEVKQSQKTYVCSLDAAIQLMVIRMIFSYTKHTTVRPYRKLCLRRGAQRSVKRESNRTPIKSLIIIDVRKFGKAG